MSIVYWGDIRGARAFPPLETTRKVLV